MTPVELPKFTAGPLRIILEAEAAAAFDDLTRDKGLDQLSGQKPFDWPNSFRTSRPQIVVPCGFVNNSPFGLAFTGKVYDEGAPLRAALAYEHATAWHTMHPKMDWVDKAA
jgi:Asp-tRNA(Asn)/Glu-tRNA(Gln) amidotransferase A subunit family amidase